MDDKTLARWKEAHESLSERLRTALEHLGKDVAANDADAAQDWLNDIEAAVELLREEMDRVLLPEDADDQGMVVFRPIWDGE